MSHLHRIKSASSLLMLCSIAYCFIMMQESFRITRNIPFLWHASKDTPAVRSEDSTKQKRTFEKRPVTRVLLITYYRGGSSFLGQMLAQNNEAFYWFEPLDRVGLTAGTLLSGKSQLVESYFQVLPNRTLGYLPRERILPRREIVRKTLTCNATQLSKETLSGKFFRTGRAMARFSPYLQCLRRNITHKHEICTEILEKTCLNSTIIAAKVIRYPMYEVQHLMGIIPDLKVIHYVRDPRGMLASRAHIHKWLGTKLMTISRYLCEAIEKNMNVFKLMQQRHPEQFLLVRYEDLALNTNETVQRIYEFVGQNIPEKLYKWIEGNTKAKRIDWLYGTRRNSKEIAYKWRKSLKTKDCQIITDQCNAVLKELNYQI